MRVSSLWPLRARHAGTLALLLALAACTTPIEPKILTFNYGTIAALDPAMLIDRVASGQTTVDDELGSNPCNFTADAEASTPLSIDFLGMPGEEGFNVTISSASLVNLTTTNPPACPAVTEINMTIGALGESLDVGGRTNATGAEIIVGGDGFATGSGFFEGTLSHYSRQTGYGSGRFQFAAFSPARSAHVVLLVSGSYADD